LKNLAILAPWRFQLRFLGVIDCRARGETRWAVAITEPALRNDSERRSRRETLADYLRSIGLFTIMAGVIMGV